jgi:heme/copper-type cytochrome/quinol oxidase subunit 3
VRRVANAPVMPLTDPSAERELTRHRIRLQSTAMFWHFVDAAWIGTFAVVYLG